MPSITATTTQTTTTLPPAQQPTDESLTRTDSLPPFTSLPSLTADLLPLPPPSTTTLAELTDIIDVIRCWINHPHRHIPNRMHTAHSQKSCWEAWAKVEIACLLQWEYDNVAIDRQGTVYDTTAREREKELIISDYYDSRMPRQIVELTCERGSQSAGDFRREMLRDCEKVEGWRVEGKWKPAKAYAIAIGVTQASQKLFLATKWPEGVKVTGVQCASGIWSWWHEWDLF